MEVGTFVKFDPIQAIGGLEPAGDFVTAPVVYINKEHRWFGVRHNGITLTWSFDDLGRVVWLESGTRKIKREKG